MPRTAAQARERAESEATTSPDSPIIVPEQSDDDDGTDVESLPAGSAVQGSTSEASAADIIARRQAIELEAVADAVADDSDVNKKRQETLHFKQAIFAGHLAHESVGASRKELRAHLTPEALEQVVSALTKERVDPLTEKFKELRGNFVLPIMSYQQTLRVFRFVDTITGKPPFRDPKSPKSRKAGKR